MITLQTVISQTLDKGKRIITSLGWGKFNNTTASQAAPFGVDSVPVKDMIALYAKTSNDAERVIVGYINKWCLADAGEIRIYSTKADGSEGTRVWVQDDGVIEIGGTGAKGSNANHLVRWEDLNTALQQLKSDMQSDMVTIFNAHVHPTPSGVSGATTTPMTQPNIDITSAKTTKLKINGD